MNPTPIHTADAPEAIGSYSQAVTVGDFVFCSGQIALDPKTMEMVGETEKIVYNYFGTYVGDNSKKPIGWYKTRYSLKTDKHILGPIKEGKERYGGFIPDRINDIILHGSGTAEQKYKLLNRMFRDLIKLKKEYKGAKK